MLQWHKIFLEIGYGLFRVFGLFLLEKSLGNTFNLSFRLWSFIVHPYLHLNTALPSTFLTFPPSFCLFLPPPPPFFLPLPTNPPSYLLFVPHPSSSTLPLPPNSLSLLFLPSSSKFTNQSQSCQTKVIQVSAI